MKQINKVPTQQRYQEEGLCYTTPNRPVGYLLGENDAGEKFDIPRTKNILDGAQFLFQSHTDGKKDDEHTEERFHGIGIAIGVREI